MNKIQKIGVVIVAAGLCVATANAITVNWSEFGVSTLTLQGGAIGVAQGALIEIGLLNGATAADMQANQGNISFLNNHFNPFATSTVGTGVGLDGM